MTAETWVKVLTFSSGVILLLNTFLSTVPTIDGTQKVLIGAGATLLIGIIDLGLAVFFQVRKPITTAYARGVESVTSAAAKAAK